jgi:hypothetical protein
MTVPVRSSAGAAGSANRALPELSVKGVCEVASAKFPVPFTGNE